LLCYTSFWKQEVENDRNEFLEMGMVRTQHVGCDKGRLDSK
jgi:hypothetical protein